MKGTNMDGRRESKAWNNFLKLLHYGSRGLSVLATIVSLGLAIYSAYATNNPQIIGLDWRIVICIIIFNSTFLIGATIYECVIFVFSRKIKKEKDSIAAELIASKNKNELKSDYIDKLLDYSSCINLEYNKEYNKINFLHQKFKTYIEEKTCLLVSTQENLDKAELEEVVNNVNTFKNDIIKNFNDFVGFVVNELQAMINTTLIQKGFQLTCSIAIKQMDSSYFEDSSYDYKNVKIITCYRDRESYIHKNREVGKKIYSIEKNTSFLLCQQHEYFLKNNLTGIDATYHNENGDFLKYYNCSAVVPIFGLYGTVKCYFGYLGCDALNKDENCGNVFDEETIKIMKTASILLGGYFDEHYLLWNNSIKILHEFIDNTKINNKQLISICDESDFIRMLFNIKQNQSKNSYRPISMRNRRNRRK